MADGIQYAPQNTPCVRCLKKGHRCIAYQIIEGEALCLYCADNEPCIFEQRAGAPIPASATEAKPAVKQSKPPAKESPKMENCPQCNPAVPRPFGHKGRHTGASTVVKPKKSASPAAPISKKNTVADVLAEIDRQIADLEKAKAILARFAAV